MQPILIPRGKTVVVPVSIGFNVSQNIIASDIRVGPTQSSELIASWKVTFDTNGKDGELILTLDHSVTSNVVQDFGYMDLRRIGGGPPASDIDEPIVVLFVYS